MAYIEFDAGSFEDKIVGPFTHYQVEPVFFGGPRPFRGALSKENYATLEKARVAAIKLIQRNKDAGMVKGFIKECHRGYPYGYDVEKVFAYQIRDPKTYKIIKTTYYMEIEGKRTYVYRLNSKTGEIVEKVRKKDL